MNAISAKTAKGRAGIAARLIKTVKPWPQGRGLDFSREFDNCFEMFDGDKVVALLMKRLEADDEFRRAVLRHWPTCGGVGGIARKAREMEGSDENV